MVALLTCPVIPNWALLARTGTQERGKKTFEDIRTGSSALVLRGCGLLWEVNFFLNRKEKKILVWWHMPVISTLGRLEMLVVTTLSSRPRFKTNKQNQRDALSMPSAHRVSTWREEKGQVTGRAPELSVGVWKPDQGQQWGSGLQGLHRPCT